MKGREIVNKQLLAKDVFRLTFEAKEIARTAKPGQFIMVVPREQGCWVALAISETDLHRGTVTVVFKQRGDATRALGAMRIHDSIYSVMGPLGKPARIAHYGSVICVAQEISIASLLPICRAFKSEGNKVTVILAARTKSKIILEAQIRLACHKMHIVTEDGTYMRRGKPVAVLEELIDKDKCDLIYAIGDIEMMQAACALARTKNIPVRIQVHGNFSCGIGVCRSCRIKAREQTVLACQEGPEFDGQSIDFELLWARLETGRKDPSGRDEDHDEVDVAAKFFPGHLKDY